MANKKTDFDVIIVGAGPAGASSARELSQKGYKVLLIEKNQQIGEPNFSSAGTPDYLLKEFNLPKSVVADWWDKFEIVTPNNNYVWQYKNKRGYVLKFNNLKKFLVECAIKNGCKVFVGTNATGPVLEGKKIIGVSYGGIQSGSATAKIVVDASGPPAVIASKIGLRKSVLCTPCVAMEYILEGKTPKHKNTLMFYLGNKFAPHGYAWIFPMGKNQIKVGVGIAQSAEYIKGSVLNVLKNFMAEVPWLNNFQPLELHGSSLYINGGIKNTVFQNVLTIGDSAAQVNPLGAEGIRHALRASKMAADAIDETIQSEDIGKLNNYQKSWSNYVGRKWRISQLLGEVVYHKFGDNLLDECLEISKSLSAEDVFDLFFEYKFIKGLKVLKGDFRGKFLSYFTKRANLKVLPKLLAS